MVPNDGEGFTDRESDTAPTDTDTDAGDSTPKENTDTQDHDNVTTTADSAASPGTFDDVSDEELSDEAEVAALFEGDEDSVDETLYIEAVDHDNEVNTLLGVISGLSNGTVSREDGREFLAEHYPNFEG